MTRHLLLGFGSRGDVEPFLALALGLQEAGHEVVVAAGRDYGPWVRSHGVAAEPFSIDMQEAMRTPLGRRWLGGSSHSGAEELATMREVFAEFAAVLAVDLLRMVRPGDVVVSSALTFNPMLSLAPHRGARHVLAMFTPGLPTRSGAASLLPARPAGTSSLNALTGAAAVSALYAVMDRPGRRLRQMLGLPRMRYPTYARAALRVPVLLAASRHLLPAPQDWPGTVRQTGAWQVPDRQTPELPAEVKHFLGQGEPPVYLGLGSMTNGDPFTTLATLVGAALHAGVRAVVHRGVDLAGVDLDDIVGERDRDRVLFVDAVSHARLLPRVAAAVHHGGAGTTHAVARAGVPHVVVPHIGDQPYWARRVHELGVGAAPIPRHALTVPALAGAIRAVTGDPAPRHRAVALGRLVRSEDGVRTAVHLLAGPSAG